MIRTLLRRLFGLRRREPEPPPTIESAELAASVWSRSPLTAVAVQVPAADPAALGSYLEAQLAERIALVLASAPSGKDNDIARLAEAMAAGPGESIRQFPASAQKALDLTQRDSVELLELVALCETDPALAQAVLRSASSAIYGGATVASLREAVMRVGAGGVRASVLAVVVRGLLCRPGGPLGAMASQVFEHMVRTGPLAACLAPAFSASKDEAFTVGLLHDTGKLVIFDQATQLRTQLKRELVLPADQLAHLLRVLHEPLGGLAVLRWGLGPVAARAVALHHRSPVPTERDPLSEVAYLAERLDLASMAGKPVDLAETWQAGALTGAAARVESLLSRAA